MDHTASGIPVFMTNSSRRKDPVILALHGAGLAAVSYAQLAKQLKKQLTFTAFDFRGHGYSKIGNGEELDLSLGTLMKETIEVLAFVIEKYPARSIILMGHSMGGAIATKTALFLQKNFPLFSEKIKGIILIDALESIALESIPQMKEMIKQR